MRASVLGTQQDQGHEGIDDYDHRGGSPQWLGVAGAEAVACVCYTHSVDADVGTACGTHPNRVRYHVGYGHGHDQYYGA